MNRNNSGIRFSDRTDWNREENRVIQALNKIKASNSNLIDLTESNPTRCHFTFSQKKISDALLNNANCAYQPDAKGQEHVRTCLTEYYSEKGIALNSDNIYLTSSTSEAYNFIFRLLTNPGDQICFPTPSYPLFSYLTEINDCETLYYQLNYSDGWHIDLKELETKVSEKTKVLVLVNPNNPTGNYVKKGELAKINQFCAQNNLTIVCDEVFSDYTLNSANESMSLAGNTDVLTFTMSGISKMLAMPQMKISWIVINGPDELVKEARERLEIILDTFLSVNTPAQNAFPIWYQLKKTIQAEILGRLNQNYANLTESILKEQNIELLKSEGGWYAVIKTNKEIEEEETVLALLKEGVFVHPGFFYDFIQNGVFVLSLLIEEKEFKLGSAKVLQLIR